MCPVSSSPRRDFPERDNYLSESWEGLLAEVHKDPEEIAELLSSQISQFLKFSLQFFEESRFTLFKSGMNCDLILCFQGKYSCLAMERVN